MKLITQKAEGIQETLRTKGDEFMAFRKNAPPLWSGKDGTSFQNERLAAIETKRSELRIRRAEIESRLALLKAATNDAQQREGLVRMVQEWSRRSDIDRTVAATPLSLDDKLFPLLMQETMLLRDCGPAHPDVLAVRDQIKFTRAFFDTQEKKPAATEKPAQTASSNDPVQTYAVVLEQELRDNIATDGSLATLFEQDREEAKKLADYQFEENRYVSEMARAEKFHDSLITQLQGINLGKDLGGYTTSVISPPGDGFRVEPRVTSIMSIAVFFGLLGGMGLAYLAEISDKSFRSPDEIRNRLGLPVVGNIPFCTPARGAKAMANNQLLDTSLCTYYRSKSSQAEAYRAVRTALYFSTQGETHKVIQVTSANPGDGKTTVSTNLAVSIAQSGKNTLLIDADLRKPRVHKVFGMSAEIGLASLIEGDAELDDAVQPSGVPNLSILPCGPCPSNPAELLTSPRFAELLELIKERYEFVIVDSPPMMAVTDPCVVAPRVDGVLLTIKLTKQGRPAAERATQILRSIDANILGVVVNHSDRGLHAEGYGYGQYGYGYGYGYSYGYSDSYAKHNYTDDSADALEADTETPDESSNGQAELAHAGAGSSSSWLGRLLHKNRS